MNTLAKKLAETPERELETDPKLAQALARVAADAERDPEAFLEETRVPDGGE